MRATKTSSQRIDQRRLMEVASALRISTERGEPIRISIFDERGLIGEAWLPDNRDLPLVGLIN